MRRLAALAALAMLAASAGPALSQDAGGKEPEPEVLVRPGTRHGGWGGPVVMISRLADRDAVLVGGRGGWIVDGRATVGLAGFGVANDVRAPRALQPETGTNDLELGYGGLWLEYTVRPLRLVHVSFGALVGGGGIQLVRRDGGDVGPDDAFFVVEPTAEVELNLARSVRADVGVSYRWVNGVGLGRTLDDGDVRAFGVSLGLKFGSF